MLTKALQSKIWGSPLTANEREALKRIRSLSKKEKLIMYNAMKKFFIDTGISSKDGKLINRGKLKEFRQMLAEQRKQKSIAQKSSKKLK